MSLLQAASFFTVGLFDLGLMLVSLRLRDDESRCCWRLRIDISTCINSDDDALLLTPLLDFKLRLAFVNNVRSITPSSLSILDIVHFCTKRTPMNCAKSPLYLFYARVDCPGQGSRD